MHIYVYVCVCVGTICQVYVKCVCVIGLDIYTLICIKWITNKNLLHKKINKIQNKKNV